VLYVQLWELNIKATLGDAGGKLQSIQNKQCVKLWIELFWLSLRGPAQGFCEYNNKHSGSFCS